MGSEHIDTSRKGDQPMVPTAALLGDDAEVESKTKVPGDLMFDDSQFVSTLLTSLNTMRQNGQFCDVILQVGVNQLAAHRCVLASVSQYLAKLFVDDSSPMAAASSVPTTVASTPTIKASAVRRVFRLPDNLDTDSLEALMQYAYTGRLHVHASKVRSIYWTSYLLRADRVTDVCAEWLVNNLDTRSCLEVRAIKGIASNTQLVTVVDKFIRERFGELVLSKQLLKLPQIKVELLTPVLEQLNDETMLSKALLVLDWLRSQDLNVDQQPLPECLDKLHFLYMNSNKRLHDCSDIHKNDSANTEIVQDYKKLSKKISGRKISRGSGGSPAGLVEHADSYSVSPGGSERGSAVIEGQPYWTVVACSKTDDRGMVCLVTIGGVLSVISLRQRLNPPSPAATPVSSRPASLEKPDNYSMLPELSCPKCATGVGNLDGQVIVCGGYDRGECLRECELYDPTTNLIRPLPPMLEARGRFDLTVLAGRAYAVGGSDGTHELTSVEVFALELNEWRPCAPLSMARSNTGVCALEGRIYCVGGWNGKFGSKKCEVYDPELDQWRHIASLSTGRYQAAVTVLDGMVMAVGGCDSWNCLNSVEAYDPATDRWINLAPMSTPRRGAGISKLNGKVIVVGGSDGIKSLSSTEIYEPDRCEWVPGPKMTSRRANVNTAAVNGKLFAVGGFTGKQFLNTMEFLEPGTMAWSTFISRRSRGLSGGSTGSDDEPATTSASAACAPAPPAVAEASSADIIPAANGVDGNKTASLGVPVVTQVISHPAV